MTNNVILHIATYPPRECGIATYTQDLVTAMDNKFNPQIESKIIAMDHNALNYNYPDKVIFNINQDNIEEYINVAEEINEMGSVKLVSIQHEFGIFGGYYGKYLLKFIEVLNKPYVVTFHTIVPDSISINDARKRIVQMIAKKARYVIVLNKLAINILKEDYGVDDSKIVVIPHGIHDVSFEYNAKEKEKLGYKDKLLLTTFGFIRKSKGIENVINALPEVVDKFPDVLYLIIGEIHQNNRSKGESYLEFLKNKVNELNIQKHVKLINNYIALNEIISYLKATDLYLCSTKNKGQIVSGTLAYAMGCGRAIVSTPFLHAKEIVSPQRGIIVEDFNNPKLFTNAIIKLLSNPSLRKKMGKNAYEYTRHMTWSNVAESHMNVFKEYLI